MICVSLNCTEQFEQNRNTHLHCTKQCRERDTRRTAFKRITQKYCTRKCKEVAQNRRRSNDLAERRRLESLNPACSIRLAYLLDCQLRDVRSQPAAEHGRMFSEPLRKAAA